MVRKVNNDAFIPLQATLTKISGMVSRSDEIERLCRRLMDRILEIFVSCLIDRGYF